MTWRAKVDDRRERISVSRRAFVLPAIALLVAGVAYGPDLWHRYYRPVREYCEMYLASASIMSLISPIVAGVGLLAVAGGGVRLMTHLRSNNALSRRIRSRTVPPPAALERAAVRADLHVPVICLTEAAPFAFCRGLATPVIYVSIGLIELLDQEELSAVLAHEEAHASGRDPLRVLAARFLAGTLLFLPIARLLEEQYVLSLEFKADRRAADAISLPHLASALLKLLEVPSGDTPARASLAIHPTEERIRRLTAEAGESDRHRSGLQALSAPVFWSAVSSLLAGGAIALVLQVISSVTRCAKTVA